MFGALLIEQATSAGQYRLVGYVLFQCRIVDCRLALSIGKLWCKLYQA